MRPLLPGAALTGNKLFSNYSKKGASGNVRIKSIFPPGRKPSDRKSQEANQPEGKQRKSRVFTLANPLKSLSKANPLKNLSRGLNSTLRGFASALSQITKKPVEEDYQAIARNFVPAEAVSMMPQNPSVSRGIQFADLDGDTRNELIASYKMNNAVRTIILKKQEENWYKLGEINHPEFDTLEYRDAADITGKGKMQLLMRVSSKGRAPVLYGYTVENSSIKEMFSRNCHKVHIVPQPQSRGGTSKAQLALWNRRDPDGYRIELLNWNGSQLEPAGNAPSYFARSVAPYYAAKVKRSPNTPANWYNLADTLANAGANRDASVAIGIGMKMDKDAALKDMFEELKNRISEP